jgi:MEMO1 family protein
MITFIDPMRLAGGGFALHARVAPLLSMMDGRHDVRDIQMGLMHLFGGSIVPIADVEALIAQFDQAFLLDSDAFRLKKTEIMEDFARKDIREPILAGTSYEKDPDRLRAYIASVESSLPVLPDQDDDIVGILAPHIEIAAADKAYVDAYRRIKDREYDLVIVLGINHHGGGEPYCLTEKDYVTPLCTLNTDREFVAKLKAGLPDGSVALYDFDHMMEHSIEFQAVFLANYLGASARIVPVLCGGIHEYLASGKDLFDDERFIAFRDGILGIIEKSGRKVLFVSGVDFSHIGYKFGHSLPAASLVDSARANDRLIIDHLINARARDILKNARDTGDQFNVCGLTSMMLFSSLTGKCTSKLLHHGTYDESATNSAVTFASMVFTRA